MEIYAHAQGDMVHFKVKDNGQGIEQGRLEQLGKAVVPSKKGTGTALYNINQRLIGLFGKDTTLHIESELEKGTEILFTIPIQNIGEEESGVKGISS